MEEVGHGWRLIGPGPSDDASLQVVHVIAKRCLIDPLMAEARSMGVPISAVDVVGAEGDRMGFNLLSRGEAAPSLARRLSWVIATAAALLVLVSAATVVVAVQRQDQALAQLEVETNAARTEAQAVRKRIKDADTLSHRIGAFRLRRAEGIRGIAYRG